MLPDLLWRRRERKIDPWRIGIAGCWPDIIRRSPQDRPSRHYQLGASVVIGNVVPPSDPGPLPAGATLDTQELHIGQAFDLCRQVFADRSRPDADRAIALCWLRHLVADGHQPCHVGSLYAEGVFPDGTAAAIRSRSAGGEICIRRGTAYLAVTPARRRFYAGSRS